MELTDRGIRACAEADQPLWSLIRYWCFLAQVDCHTERVVCFKEHLSLGSGLEGTDTRQLPWAASQGPLLSLPSCKMSSAPSGPALPFAATEQSWIIRELGPFLISSLPSLESCRCIWHWPRAEGLIRSPLEASPLSILLPFSNIPGSPPPLRAIAFHHNCILGNLPSLLLEVPSFVQLLCGSAG